MNDYAHKVINGFNASGTNVYRKEWYAPLTFFSITATELRFEFIWDSASYKVEAKSNNDVFFHGTIFKSNEKVRGTVLTHYQNEIGHSLLGNWEENGDSFSCLVEARN